MLKRLHFLNSATGIDYIKENSGSTKFKHFSGNNHRFYDYYAIEIDSQFRLMFRWDHAQKNAYDVEVADFHGE